MITANSDGTLTAAIGDFGISQILDEHTLVVKQFQVVNKNGISLAYAAPELIAMFNGNGDSSQNDAAIKRAADVYSYGILLNELVNRLFPW